MFKYPTISTEQEAYILGFLYADGFVTGRKNGKYYSVGATVSESDRQILINISQLFFDAGYVARLKDRVTSYGGKPYKTANLRIGNVGLVQTLIQLGISPNKTYEQSSKVFDSVPDHLQHHFVRGYFDGDGSIYHPTGSNKHSIKIISLNVPLMRRMDKWILQRCNPTIKTENHFAMQDGKYPRIQHNGNPNCIKIRDVLYKDATIFLNRKRDIFYSIPSPRITKSSHKGVHWNKQRNNWMVRIYLDKNSKPTYCGSFKTEEEAILEYEKRRQSQLGTNGSSTSRAATAGS
jgi:hypothetical protein